MLMKSRLWLFLAVTFINVFHFRLTYAKLGEARANDSYNPALKPLPCGHMGASTITCIVSAPSAVAMPNAVKGLKKTSATYLAHACYTRDIVEQR